MSESENTPPAKVDNRFNESIAEDIENLQSSVQALQSTVSFSLILVLVFTVCLNLYIGIQVLGLRGQVHAQLAKADDFQKTKVPAIAEFWGKLSDFGARHPDFKPVLTKYTQGFKDRGIVITPPKK